MNIGELVILRQGDKYIIVFNFEMSKKYKCAFCGQIVRPTSQLAFLVCSHNSTSKKTLLGHKTLFFLFLVPNPILFDDSNPFIYILAQNNPFGPVRILKGAKNDFRPKSPILGAQIGQIWFKIKILGGNFYSIYSYPSPK